MKIEETGSSNESLAMEVGEMKIKVVEEQDQFRVKRKTLQAVLEQCQRALELLSNNEVGIDDDDEDDVDPQGELCGLGLRRDQEADELCDLPKSRVRCSDFLKKLECAQVPVPENIAGLDSQSTSGSTKQDLLCKREKRKASKSMGWR